jgi:spore coat polysaccharide biosynthesis protein SpsF
VRIAVFVQARMSSRRFPGKVLAPFRGRPLLDHVLDAVRSALPDAPLKVVTSDEPSDDPVAAYVASRGIDVFRGPRDDVLGRFRRALDASPNVEWVLRICADSPLLSASVIRKVVEAARPDVDLVTTTHQRTFPRGQNAELIAASVLRSIDGLLDATAEDREHVTRAIHNRPERFRIVNVVSGNPELAQQHHSVDTIEDLVRLENVDAEQVLGRGSS